YLPTLATNISTPIIAMTELAATGSLRTSVSTDTIFASNKGDTVSQLVEDDLRWILRPQPGSRDERHGPFYVVKSFRYSTVDGPQWCAPSTASFDDGDSGLGSGLRGWSLGNICASKFKP
ncbi:hypothetical protein FRB90_000457, partial [Tulasnella sp. 427]